MFFVWLIFYGYNVQDTRNELLGIPSLNEFMKSVVDAISRIASEMPGNTVCSISKNILMSSSFSMLKRLNRNVVILLSM